MGKPQDHEKTARGLLQGRFLYSRTGDSLSPDQRQGLGLAEDVEVILGAGHAYVSFATVTGSGERIDVH